MGEMPERRSFPRYPCKGTAEIFQNGQRLEWGTVSDIGHCGCYLEIASPFVVGAQVDLHISLADCYLEINAKVICATPLVGMGLEFLAPSREQANALARMIATVTGTAPDPALASADRPQPASATIQITREAAPAIFVKMLRRINEKGVLTKEELVEMVKNH